ncbi:MAG: NifU N-terminal domain-containing protein [Pseudomonadota bacterium]
MSERRPQISIYRHPNPEIRSFLTLTEITNYRMERFTDTSGEAFEAQLRGLGIIGEYVVREILAIPGVREVEIKPRELRIKKEPAVSWDQIENRVIDALNTAFRRKEIRAV